MRRPAAVFCLSAFGIQLAAALLPRAVFGLLAAFFILLAAPFAVRRRGYALCCVLGVLAGSVGFFVSEWYNLRPVRLFAEKAVVLTATVESAADSYADGMVSAVLRAEGMGAADGEALRAGFLFRCDCLPQCAPGERISGLFALSALDGERMRSDYADGIFLQGEFVGSFTELGRSSHVRAVFARLRTRLSSNIRWYLNRDTGGILAAITVGDRGFVSQKLSNAYRAAGLSHIMVVSGLHLSLLCGLFGTGRTQKPKSRRRKVLLALVRMAAALGMMGITGFTPSVLRAGVAIMLANFGVLLLARPDGLTSLSVAAFLLLLPNGYAGCDVGLQLSLAATAGVLAGSAAARPVRKRLETMVFPLRETDRTAFLFVKLAVRGITGTLWETFCIACFAVLATFPVLVAWGMSVSPMALISCFAALALAEPILVCGLGAALCGLLQPLQFLHCGFALCGGVFVKLLNRWVLFAASAAGAGLRFETGYAVAVYCVLVAVYLLGRKWKIPKFRLFLAQGLVLCTALLLGSLLSRGIVTVALVGNARDPAVVVTSDDAAMVLFRGGAYNRYRVTEYLAQRGIAQVEQVIDLRLASDAPSGLAAVQEQRVKDIELYKSSVLSFKSTSAELYHTQQGVLVCLNVGGVTLGACAGDARIAHNVPVDYFLGASGSYGSFAPRTVLCRSESCHWLANCKAETIYFGASALSVRLRPGGGAQITGAVKTVKRAGT